MEQACKSFAKYSIENNVNLKISNNTNNKAIYDFQKLVGISNLSVTSIYVTTVHNKHIFLKSEKKKNFKIHFIG